MIETDIYNVSTAYDTQGRRDKRSQDRRKGASGNVEGAELTDVLPSFRPYLALVLDIPTARLPLVHSCRRAARYTPCISNCIHDQRRLIAQTGNLDGQIIAKCNLVDER